jgi:uncharacterized membrane protein
VSKRSRRRNKRGRNQGAMVPKPGSSPQLPPGSPAVRGDLSSIVAFSGSSYSGPLPPPEILREFDQVVPGAAERIMRMAEKQQDHRIRLESKVITSDTYRSWAGLGLAGFLGFIIVGCGSYLIFQGHDTAGATIITSTLIGLVTTFVHGTRSRRQERETKDPGRKKSH